MTVFLQYLANGLTMGSVYAIIALGYTMVYGIAKMLNFAHGDVIMIGAYISFVATSYLSLPPMVSVLASIAVCTVLGVLIEGLAYKPVSYTHLEDTFGVSAAAPAAVVAGPVAAAEEAEEKTEFDVVLEGFGDNKIQVIKAVRELTNPVSYTHLAFGGHIAGVGLVMN